MAKQFWHILQKVNTSYHCLYRSATQVISAALEIPTTDENVERSDASSQERSALGNECYRLFTRSATELPICVTRNVQNVE